MEGIDFIIIGAILYIASKGFLKTAVVLCIAVFIWIGWSVIDVYKNTPSEEERECRHLQFITKDEYGIFSNNEINFTPAFYYDNDFLRNYSQLEYNRQQIEAQSQQLLKNELILQSIERIRQNKYDCSKYK